MEFIVKAFRELYPDKYEGRYGFDVNYSGKFKGYNANVRYTRSRFTFNLSSQWKDVNEDIRIGLIQTLFNKVFKTKINTTSMGLYDLFLKNIHLAIPKDKVEPILQQSFERINEKYFYGMITMPNLVFGQMSTRKLGSYDYGTDTISISKVLLNDFDALDYVMFHEILHKKHKFYTKNGKSYSHTGNFKKEEQRYEDFDDIEKKLRTLTKRSKKWSFEDYFG